MPKIEKKHALLFLEAAVGIVLLTKLYTAIFRKGGWDAASFNSILLWKGLIIAFAGYALFALAALILGACQKALPAYIIFPTGLFSAFFAYQVNQAYIHLSPRLMLLCFIAAAYAGIFIAFKRGLLKCAGGPARLGSGEAVILLWLILTGLFFFKFNFDLTRVVFMDEGTFWITRARDFTLGLDPKLSTVFLTTHSLGIPFISSLPNLAFGTLSEPALFFMPLVIIITLGMFLYALRGSRWQLLYFVLMLLLTFNKHAWLRMLHFGLNYGDGLSAVFLLVIVAAIMQVQSRQTGGPTIAVAILGFAAGLLVYTKAPAAYISFSLPVLLVCGPNLSVKQRLAACCCFFLPFIAQSFYMRRVLEVGYTGRFFHPAGYLIFDFTAAKKITAYLLENYRMPLICGGVSLALIIGQFRGRQYLYLLPVAAVLMFVLYGYVTVFSAQEIDSSARYFSQAGLLLYYLGAVAFSRIMSGKDDGRDPTP